MSKLTVESAHEIIEYNRNVLYHIPAKYKYLREYLSGSLRDTLFSVLKFISDKRIVIADHKYIFFADNTTLTHRARKKSSGMATTSRHMNLLCAIGLINKQYQSKTKDKLIEVNKNFFANNPDRQRSINVYSFRRYDNRELKRIEERAERLALAGVTSGNFSQSMLVLHGLEDLSNEVLPKNNRNAPQRKAVEYQELLCVLNYIVDSKGYATKEQIRDNLLIDDKELDKVFRIFRRDIGEQFYYKRPTKQQIKQWELKTLKFIYTKKEG